MKLLLFHLRRKWWLLIVGIVLFAVFFYLQPNLIYPSFITHFESGSIVVFSFFAAFVMANRSEVEMCKYRGLRLSRLLTAQAFPILLYAFITATPVLCTYKIRGASLGPIGMLQVCVSAMVTLLLFMSVFIFIRVFFRNTYAVFGFILMIYYPIAGFHDKVMQLLVPPELYGYDVFIQAIMYYERWGPIPQQTWFINRGAYLLIAIILYTASCFIVNSKTYEDLK